MELLSLMAVMSEGLGFNLCVAPFLVINLFKYFKLCDCQNNISLELMPVYGTQLVINACESLSHGNLGT